MKYQTDNPVDIVVRRWSLGDALDGGPDIEAELRRGNDLWNRLVEIDRTSKPYDDFQKWCREIVWWGNKKGAYLYSPNATAITPELAGHY